MTSPDLPAHCAASPSRAAMVRFLEFPQWLKTPGQKFANEPPGSVARQDFIPREVARMREKSHTLQTLPWLFFCKQTRSPCVHLGFVKLLRFEKLVD